MIDIAAIDNYLGQHGQFSLLDWLLSENLLAYSDYERWRYGKTSLLSTAILCNRKQLANLAKTSTKLCKKLKLCDEEQLYLAWGEQQQKYLKFDNDADIQGAFSKQWLRAQDVPQLDLFMDNSAVVTENQLCDALANRQFEQAARLIKELTELNPNNDKLGGFQSLLIYSQHIMQNAEAACETLGAEISGLEDEVMPLAEKLLQRGSRDYLAVAWRRIAHSLRNTPYDPQRSKQHASYALAQIPDWQTATQLLKDNPQTFEHCCLTTRLADAFYYLNDHAKARYCWALAFEQWPQAAEELLEIVKPISVYPLWERFGELKDAWPDVFFAGFILASEPALVFQRDYFPEFKQSSTQLVADLMGKKMAGEDLINARQHVQDYSPSLLRMVMSV